MGVGTPDEEFMRRALALAAEAERAGEVPVGAVVVLDGVVIGEGWNRPISTRDPSAHAEMVALRAAAAHVGNYRLTGSTLYATLEPCPMCAGAMVHARVARVVYGARDPIAGAAGGAMDVFGVPTLNHHPVVESGLLAEEASQCLKAFFRSRRC